MPEDCWQQIGVQGDRSCPQLDIYIHCRNCPVYTSAGRALLEREVPADYLAERTELLTQVKLEEAVDSLSLCIFRLGGEWLALNSQYLVEVTEPVGVHSLPHRSNAILLGITSIRGEILMCISLKDLLGITSDASTPAYSPIVYHRMVVIAQSRHRWVFSVDEMSGIFRIPSATLQPPPSTLSKATRTYTKAIVNWQNKSVSYLDDELLFYTLDHQVLT
ncbi:purine-binding chemotaxis protein CheW [Desertifilum sp. FACHB-1129]|uniref:Chemotaxis protein CheW n=1 Tax=Desertifilum tharense IPPAS B-1220 TaxID=1781255 RepID=A0A1E5QHY6_9CYAN|nr:MULTISPECIES: chemotaxis protein CheW [Desertifilum]MDA0211373.1 chemotaxis protein CheW [Cyanobacteria bacterium FC1]MBD2314008.1 purine-binding chemotaxis protein CheW [Desertifilum sp. FACHB-1129]MBD2320334.1 purine-binding chemotaxis protein CheW [Desertifilum sp. FACHB-866]MBD2330462.1 purine-binding chemotaxis protein CheW [Desertifilum sp. FACHB-868]OEJ74228.1 hypothetical protein BH720_15605 [Desertifilum tharense IPPAS B-1220]